MLCSHNNFSAGLILYMCPANEKWHHNVVLSLIGAYTKWSLLVVDISFVSYSFTHPLNDKKSLKSLLLDFIQMLVQANNKDHSKASKYRTFVRKTNQSRVN